MCIINIILPETYANTNEDFTDIKELKNEINELKLYSDYQVTADLIWNVNKRIKKLDVSIIDDSIFGLISNANLENKNNKILDNDLIITKKIKLNFNTTSDEEDKRYRDRLKTNLYILSRK